MAKAKAKNEEVKDANVTSDAEEIKVSNAATGGVVEAEGEEVKWGKAEPISHPYVKVSLGTNNFTLDGKEYNGEDYYLVSVEGGRFFVVNKKFFNFFFKIYVK